MINKLHMSTINSLIRSDGGHTALIPHVNAFNTQIALPLTPI
jgi:hypothetical protein